MQAAECIVKDIYSVESSIPRSSDAQPEKHVRPIIRTSLAGLTGQGSEDIALVAHRYRCGRWRVTATAMAFGGDGESGCPSRGAPSFTRNGVVAASLSLLMPQILQRASCAYPPRIQAEPKSEKRREPPKKIECPKLPYYAKKRPRQAWLAVLHVTSTQCPAHAGGPFIPSVDVDRVNSV